MGGGSTAAIEAVPGGANGTKGALRVTGENVPNNGPFLAGAFFSPGPAPMQAADLSGKKAISFWARGDGRNCRLWIFTESKGDLPIFRGFAAAPECKQYTFTMESLGTDAHDLAGIAFLGPGALGKFEFFIDEVEIT